MGALTLNDNATAFTEKVPSQTLVQEPNKSPDGSGQWLIWLSFLYFTVHQEHTRKLDDIK